MTTAAYNIKFSDASKAAIVIENQTFNYSTTLVLFGRDTQDWGKHLNTNLIRLLENFSNEYVPGYIGQVLEGQLWYNSDTKQLNLCTDATSVEWTPLTNMPSPELTGIVTESSILTSLIDYIPLTGNATPMTGALLVSALELTSNPLSVVTKKYVDSLVCACKNIDDEWTTNYLSDQGGIISTKLILNGDITKDSYAASKKYVTDKKIVTNSAAPAITITNATAEITGKLIKWDTDIGYYSYYGTVTIPGTTDTSPIICVCTLTDELEPNYNVVISGTYLNNLDVAGSTNTGTQSDAYVKIESGTEFRIKCAASTFDHLIYVTVTGHKA